MKEIFIVEDDQDIRELIEYLLESLDYKVKSFSDAEGFRAGIAHHIPDLVLLDIMLPDGNGLDLCNDLREHEATERIPVVLMSAHADSAVLKGHCANDFISKPFDIDHLVARINKQLV